jgi:hypothetical protein
MNGSRPLLAGSLALLLGCLDLDARTGCAQDATMCIGATPAVDAEPDSALEVGGDGGTTDTCVCKPGDTQPGTGCPTGDVGTQMCTPSCTWSATTCTPTKGWRPLAAPPMAFLGRANHSAVWTGSAMIVFGGRASSGLTGNAASYDYATDKWTAITTPTLFSGGREGHRALWAGSKMIVWGGRDELDYVKNGAMYEPATDTWTTMDPPPTSFTGRWYHVQISIPTTNRMLVWGGIGCGTGIACADGALFDPTTNTWTTVPLAPISGRAFAHAVWTGTDVVIWGGGAAGVQYRDGARYNPSTNTWTKLPDPPTAVEGREAAVAAWSGTEFLVWGGRASLPLDSGARLTLPSTWTTMAGPGTALSTSKRDQAHGWYWAGKLYVWSGVGDDAVTPLSGGAVYDLSTNAWTAMDVVGAPEPRFSGSIVYASKGAIVWGGFTGVDKYSSTGAVFVP